MKRSVALFAALLASPMVVHSQWQGGGVPLSTTDGDKSALVSIPDGASGAVTVWSDDRGPSYDLFAQRISSAGLTLWEKNGAPICNAPGHQFNGTVISDGASGFIFVWDDQRAGPRDIYAQRLDSAGSPLWTVNGVAVCAFTGTQSGPHVIPDGSGGALIAWTDTRTGTADIYAQRINNAGVVQWTAGGVPICTAADVQAVESMLATDTGEAIIVWFDRRNNGDHDIFAQRVDLAGFVKWALDGVAICTAAERQSNPVIVSDGADGAIIAWDDRRNGINEDIYIQRIDAAGVVSWTADGIELCTAPSRQFEVKAVSDGAGGAILAWTDFRSEGDIFAQRVDGFGSTLWTGDGIRLSEEGAAAQYFCDVVADGSGGAIISWNDETAYDIYAQRVDEHGIVQWNFGVPIAQGWWIEEFAVLAPNGDGGAIVSWMDWRNEIGVYAQQVNQDGIPTSVTPPARATLLAVSEARPNPFSSSTSLEIGLAQVSDVVVEVFDVRGRRVRHERFEQQHPGVRQLTFDARDNTGRSLPSGVYFYRVKAAEEALTRKVVIAR